jgi:transcriptional regulator with XRE-family HTH domain
VWVAGKKSDLGPIGIAVSHNVRRLREAQNLSYAEFSRRVTAAGRDIAPLGVRRIESGARRVDTDDLVALARALGVTPATLLMPDVADGAQQVAIAADDKLAAEQLWAWLCGFEPLDPQHSVIEFRIAIAPSWRKRLYLQAIESREYELRERDRSE